MSESGRISPGLIDAAGGAAHSNAEHYTAETLAEVKVIEGRYSPAPAQRGWEEIADYALSWAERHVFSLREHGA